MDKEIEHINTILKRHSCFNHESSNNFILNQKLFFDKESSWYSSQDSIPDFVKKRLRRIVRTSSKYMNVNDNINVLDVGSGSGVLIRYIEDFFINPNIIALDLSERQLKTLRERHKRVIALQGDITTFTSSNRFDLIYCNACFGNFIDQKKVMENISKLLADNGIFVISHPLGSLFVDKLNKSNKNIVPNRLPVGIEDVNFLVDGSDLYLLDMINEPDFYISIFVKKNLSI